MHVLDKVAILVHAHHTHHTHMHTHAHTHTHIHTHTHTHTHQDYVAMVNMFVLMEVNSREFLLGQSHLGKGEVYEAKECFERASSGLGE